MHPSIPLFVVKLASLRLRDVPERIVRYTRICHIRIYTYIDEFERMSC